MINVQVLLINYFSITFIYFIFIFIFL